MKHHELHSAVCCLACGAPSLELLYFRGDEDYYRCRACKAEHVHAYGNGTPSGRLCGDRNGTGNVECSDCDGACTHECDCGHQHECRGCLGSGEVPCDSCHGTRRKGNVPTHGPCGLALEGGELVVDACRWNDEAEAVDWVRLWRWQEAEKKRAQAVVLPTSEPAPGATA